MMILGTQSQKLLPSNIGFSRKTKIDNQEGFKSKQRKRNNNNNKV